METVKIGYNKKATIPLLIVFLLGLLGGIYHVYFSGEYDNDSTMKIIYVVGIVLLGRAIFIPARKLVLNEPVLTLSRSEIIINEKIKPVSYLWPQVLDWRIEREKKNDGSYHLIIETADKTKKVDITWLEKKPSEIEEIVKKYKKQLLREATV